MSYTLSAAGANLIKQFEGLKLTAYYDSVGVLTIGYGTTNSVLPPSQQIKPGQTITEAQAEIFLALGVNKFAPGVNNLVKFPITQGEFDSLVCFAYNVGTGNLASSTLLRKLNSGDIIGAQKEFLKWNKAGGQVLRGLTRRRLAEAVNFGSLTRQQLIDQCLGGVDPDKA
jgi:lysozyme